MGKLSRSAADSWFGLMRPRPRAPAAAEHTVGVLAFEAAGLMSKASHLWRSLSDPQISRLRDHSLRLEGVRKLVSDDDDFLLSLALSEILDSLASLVRSVARLGSRCSDPVLRRFDHAFSDLIAGGSDPYGLIYAGGKKMDRKAKKMERLSAVTANLYQEMEVLVELEQGLRRMQGAADRPDFRQRVAWQRQEVKSLREDSLWGRTFDYAVRLLARSLFTIFSRIYQVFGFYDHQHNQKKPPRRRDLDPGAAVRLPRSHSVSGLMHSSVHASEESGLTRFASGPLVRPAIQRPGTRSGPFVRPAIPRPGTRSGPLAISANTGNRGDGQRASKTIAGKQHRNSKTKWMVSGGPFGGCMVGGNDSPVLQSCIPIDSDFQRQPIPASRIHNATSDPRTEARFGDNALPLNLSLCLFDSRHKLLKARPSTLGAAALALHYANVIIVIEKLTMSPHLIGPDARDDLYSMLPTSIRAALKERLKSYAKNLASSVYDPVLAAEWGDAVSRILEWLAPLAHNMIKWQSDHNFEQQHLVSTTNVLLLQTLYFADQEKTEAAITELLVGLNYLWRFGKELNTKVVLECVSSSNYDDCLDTKGLGIVSAISDYY